jgi:hypothetical protein
MALPTMTGRSQGNDYALPACALSAVAGLVLTPVLLTSRLVPRSLSMLGIAGYALLLGGVVCDLPPGHGLRHPPRRLRRGSHPADRLASHSPR